MVGWFPEHYDMPGVRMAIMAIVAVVVVAGAAIGALRAYARATKKSRLPHGYRKFEVSRRTQRCPQQDGAR